MTKTTKAQKKAQNQKVVNTLTLNAKQMEVRGEINKLVKARLLNKYTINSHIAKLRNECINVGETPERRVWIEMLTNTLADMTGSPYDARRAANVKGSTARLIAARY
jgi:hypothetical protein